MCVYIYIYVMRLKTMYGGDELAFASYLGVNRGVPGF